MASCYCAIEYWLKNEAGPETNLCSHSQVFPTQVRTTCMGICSCIARVAGIIVSLMGGSLLSISVEVSVGTYAVAYACVVVLAYVITVDMSGRDLSQACRAANSHRGAGVKGGGRSEGDGVELLGVA